jgi:hypothetical protein
MMYVAPPPRPSPAAREREVSANTPSPAQCGRLAPGRLTRGVGEEVSP